VSSAGALLFGRYAFPPNRLGYCGPDDSQALLEQVSQGRPDQGLLQLERRFEGAYPYLCLIAQANEIPDPFDSRVVEAYWIGNEMLERVRAGPFYESLSRRFSHRMKPSEFGWLARKLELSARPHHNFHVFDVYVRAGLMRNERADIALETMDSCRISWGRVAAVEGAELVVERPQLVLAGGKLTLSEPRPFRVRRQLDGHGFVDGVKVGDMVSIHWNWACDVLGPTALSRLGPATQRSLTLANLTI
jgi:Family of unknown function (DUF6390)